MNFILHLFLLFFLLVSGPLIAKEFVVDVYNKNQSLAGNTIFGYNQNLKNIRIIEVNSDGKVVWKYKVPRHLLAKRSIVWDVKVIHNTQYLIFNTQYTIYNT